MGATRWTLFAVLASLSLLIILGNLIESLKAMRQGRNYSAIPLIGGAAGWIACLICQFQAIRWFYWLPLLLDYTFAMFVYAVLFIICFRR
jgi:hypothetical protein